MSRTYFCVPVVHCWVLQISPKKPAQSFTFQIEFSIERSRKFACFCAFWHVIFENQSIFGHNIYRLSYSCGLLIAFFQILWVIRWRTFLVSSFGGHWNFTDRLTSDVIMVNIIGCAISHNYASKVDLILVPRGRAPFGQHQKITTSGQVQHRKSAIHGLPVTLRMLRVKSDKCDWFWSQSIVFTKPFKTGMSLDRARGRDFWCWPKGPRPLGTRMSWPLGQNLGLITSRCSGKEPAVLSRRRGRETTGGNRA